MAKSKGRAGTHTTVIEVAQPVVRAFEKKGRVSRGMIEAGVGARRQTLKVTSLPGCLRLTVVSKGSRQELHVYGVSLDEAKVILDSPDFRNLLIHFAGE